MSRSGKLAERAFVELMKTHGELLDDLTSVLRTQGLSEPQFNVLRILRGAGPEGLPCREVAERMLTRYPDVTRLLDRLAASALVTRHRSEGDRRVVVVKGTRKGERILAKLDRAVAELHVRQLGHLSPSELTKLIALLAKARKGAFGERRHDENSTSA